MRLIAASALAILAAGTDLVLAQSDASDLARKAYALDLKLKASEALVLYLRAEALQPDNSELLVRIARQYRHLMADARTDAEKQKLARLALRYSERAALLAPGDSDSQLSVAITLGKLMPIESTKEQVENSKRIKASVDRAIRLNPKNDLAWFVLGRWHQGYAELSPVRRKIGEVLYGKLPDSTFADAARCFEKAVSANPNRLMHYIELGRTYERMGRREEARRLISKGLAMPSVEKDDPDIKARGMVTLAGMD